MLQVNKWLIAGGLSASLLGGAMLWEGVSYTPYSDIGGVTTVCYGYTGSDIEEKKYSEEECQKLLSNELKEHAEGILSCVKQPLTRNQFEAFTLFAYNVGVSGACSSRAIRLFNLGKTVKACDALAYSPTGTPAWSYVDGKFIQGLHNRRLHERFLCLGKGYA